MAKTTTSGSRQPARPLRRRHYVVLQNQNDCGRGDECFSLTANRCILNGRARRTISRRVGFWLTFFRVWLDGSQSRRRTRGSRLPPTFPSRFAYSLYKIPARHHRARHAKRAPTTIFRRLWYQTEPMPLDALPPSNRASRASTKSAAPATPSLTSTNLTRRFY